MSSTGDDARPHAAGDALVDRLRLIEEQPLEHRAAAYAALHDELLLGLEAPAADAP